MTGVTPECATFLGRAVPRAFRRSVLVIEPGSEHGYVPSEWVDAIVAVEAGEVWLDGEHGTCLRVGCGTVLWLESMGLRALRNAGPDRAILVSIRRWRPAR